MLLMLYVHYVIREQCQHYSFWKLPDLHWRALSDPFLHTHVLTTPVYVSGCAFVRLFISARGGVYVSARSCM